MSARADKYYKTAGSVTVFKDAVFQGPVFFLGTLFHQIEGEGKYRRPAVKKISAREKKQAEIMASKNKAPV